MHCGTVALVIEQLQKQVRRNRGRYKELSQLSGVSWSWISQFGRGLIRNPTIKTVGAIEAALKELEATEPQ